MALPRVFFDLTAGGNPVGRITMEVRLKICVFGLQSLSEKFWYKTSKWRILPANTRGRCYVKCPNFWPKKTWFENRILTP